VENDTYPDIEVSRTPTKWNDGLLDLQDNNGTKAMANYESLIDDILQQSQNYYQDKVQDVSWKVVWKC
jgi:glucose-6-phosphate 1-dehydrogenase